MKHAQIDESSRGRGFVAAAIAVALVLFAVFSTLAFLTAQTKTVENIMTSGKVDAYIDESTVDSHGYAINPITKRQDVGQVYELLPGVVYDKDPIIHVKANSETSYVYAVINDMLETPVCNAEVSPTIAEQMESNGWQTLDFAPPEGLTGTVWYKKAPVAMSSTDTDVATFETFSIKQNMSLADMELLDKTVVSVTGLLIQADGFDNAKHAYRTLYGNAKPDVADDITVTFEYNGGSVSGDTTRQISVKRGHVLTTDQIPVPTKTGYDFEGWYTDRACTSPFVASSSIENNTVLYAKWKIVGDVSVTFSNDTVPAYGVNGGKWTYKKTEDTEFIDIPNTLTVPAGSTLVEVTSLASDEPENPGLLESFKGFFASLTSGDDSSTLTDTPADSITFEVRCKDESVWGLLRLTAAENSIIDREKSPSGTIPVTSALTLTAYYKLVPKSLYFGGDRETLYCPIFADLSTGCLADQGIHFYSGDSLDDEIDNVSSMEDLVPYLWDADDPNHHNLRYLYDHNVGTEPLYAMKIDSESMCESWNDAFGYDYFIPGYEPPDSYVGNLMDKDENGNPLEYCSCLNWTSVVLHDTTPPLIYWNGNKDTCIASNTKVGSQTVYDLSISDVLDAYPFINSTDDYWINVFWTCTAHDPDVTGRLYSVRTWYAFDSPYFGFGACSLDDISPVIIRAFK